MLAHPPLLCAIEMGYGHMRPAHALGQTLGVPVLQADRPPLATPDEARAWAWTRRGYEALTRWSTRPLFGAPFRRALEELTAIPPAYPPRDLSAPAAAVVAVERLAALGLGRGLVAHLRETGAPLLTTFYAPALLADRAGLEQIFCVVTDTDLHRVWVARDPGRSRITYFAPSDSVVRRLISYGVRPDRIELTGFPLPGELIGGPAGEIARRNLAARLVRLDRAGRLRARMGAAITRALGELPEAETGRPPLVTFAIGGAGSQAERAVMALAALAPAIRAGRLRLALVAGIRTEVAHRFARALAAHGLEASPGVELLHAPDLATYFPAFNCLLARTDVLWTKPSELAFFAALGLPVLAAPPVGVHEAHNRRWLVEAGAGLAEPEADPRLALHWLDEWLDDGTLAGAAWAGFTRLPWDGLHRIAARLRDAQP